MKIISTLSNKTQDYSNILSLSDVIRINTSHIDKNWFSEIANNNEFPPIFLDLQGPKIRVSKLYTREIKFVNNEIFYICTENYFKENNLLYKRNYIPINLSESLELLNECTNVIVNLNSSFKIIEKISKNLFKMQSVGSCILRAEKGMNFIGYDKRNLPISEKDLQDLEYFIKYKPEYICYSFVESEKCLIELKNIINNRLDSKIIAKIESQRGVENIDKILEHCDGILIGRGDMQREINPLQIPEIEDLLIKKCKDANKIVFVGTDILKSLVKSNHPSIAELEKIYDFNKQQVDGLMFSDEVIINNNAKYVLEIANYYTKKRL